MENGQAVAEAPPLGSPEVLDVEVADGIGWLVMNRPHRRNAVNRVLGRALLAACIRLAADPAVRVVVLTGAGGVFCAGDDIAGIKGMFDGDAREAGWRDDGSRDAAYLRVAQHLLAMPKPVVAAIDGPCAGAGTEMACAADLRVASPRARMGSGLVNIGQLGNAVMLPRVVGPARATEIFLSGRLLDSAEALRIGLVHTVLDGSAATGEASFRQAVAEYVRPLAEGPTAAIGLFKELRERAWGQPPELGLQLQDAYHERCMQLDDAREGAGAFLQRRPARFSGR